MSKESTLNNELITENLSKLMMKTFTGQKVETTSIPVDVSVPIEIKDIIQHIAETKGQNLEELLKNIITQNIMTYINMTREQFTSSKQTQQQQPDLSSIGSKVDQLKDLMSKLNEFTSILKEK